MVGRYPFLTWVNRYLAVRGGTYSPSTVTEHGRKYRLMDRELRELAKRGEITSTNPERMCVEDVLKYIALQRAKGIKEASIASNVMVLNNLLQYVGNTAVEQCKMRHPYAMPKKRMARLASMEEREFHQIIAKARTIPETDWTRLKSYSMVVLALCSGLRLKEMRLADVSDLDTSNWTILVRHAKGEGSYGEPRPSIVRTEGREQLAKYIRARKKQVRKKCPMNKALFPALRDHGDGYLSTNGLEKAKRLVEAETGIKFDLRKCRRTFAQMFIDQGLELDSVSVMMGHLTTKTTETYYCRKKAEAAIREAEQLLTGKIRHPDAKNAKFESRD